MEKFLNRKLVCSSTTIIKRNIFNFDDVCPPPLFSSHALSLLTKIGVGSWGLGGRNPLQLAREIKNKARLVHRLDWHGVNSWSRGFRTVPFFVRQRREGLMVVMVDWGGGALLWGVTISHNALLAVFPIGDRIAAAVLAALARAALVARQHRSTAHGKTTGGPMPPMCMRILRLEILNRRFCHAHQLMSLPPSFYMNWIGDGRMSRVIVPLLFETEFIQMVSVNSGRSRIPSPSCSWPVTVLLINPVPRE